MPALSAPKSHSLFGLKLHLDGGYKSEHGAHHGSHRGGASAESVQISADRSAGKFYASR